MNYRISARVVAMAVTLIAVSWTVTGCTSNVVELDEDDDDDTEDVTPPPPRAVSFSSDIRPMLASACGGCHIGTSTSGVNLSTYAQVIGSRGTLYRAPIVVAGDADASPLVDKVASSNPMFGSRMPQGGGSLTQRQISQLREWINAGAPNN